MPRRSVMVARLVLAAAAAASVATSPAVHDWTLYGATAPIRGEVSDAMPRLVHGFHAELRAWGLGPFDGGLLTVAVTLEARSSGAGPATGRLILRSSGSPGESVGYALAPGERRTFTLDLPIFAACATDPCFDDAIFSIERDPQLDDPAVDLTITGSADATGEGRQPATGELVLTANQVVE